MTYFTSIVSGELIGVQYLFRQTGQALQDMHPDSEKTAQLIEEHDVEDDVEEDEGFSDITDDPTVLDPEVPQAPASPSPGPSTITSGLGSVAHTSSLVSSVSTLAITTSTMAPSTSTLASGTSAMPGSTSTTAPGRAEQ